MRSIAKGASDCSKPSAWAFSPGRPPKSKAWQVATRTRWRGSWTAGRPRWMRRGRRRALARIDADRANLEAALDWAVEHDTALAIRVLMVDRGLLGHPLRFA